MTIVIKGFASNSAAKNNLLGRTAVFGELSPIARTFSREILEYATDAHPAIELGIFQAKTDATAWSPPAAYTDLLLEISAWAYERGILLNNSANSTVQDFVAAFENRFSGLVLSVSASALISDGTRRMPESLRFSMRPNGSLEAQVALWFGVNAFVQEYDDNLLIVVPPVVDLSVFFQSQSAVQAALDARPVDVMIALVEEAKNQVPATFTSAQSVTWYNAAQPTQKLPCNWFVIGYGSKGNSSEAINAALSAYILSHSTQSLANWKVVMPDLFRATQFTVLPRWDRYAIAASSTAGIYSPRTSVADALNFASQHLTGVTANYIANKLEVLSHPYRSIALLTVPGEDNRAGAGSLGELIGDYIGQESLGEDFNRQSEYTKKWITDMGALLRVAEFYGTTTALGSGMRIVTHLGLECVSMKIKDVEFLVALKRNYAPV